MKRIIELDDNIVENMLDEGVCKGDPQKVIRLYQATIADAIINGIPYNPVGDLISREVINSEIEKRYCSKHCVLPSEEPYCPDNCPARFLKNIVKECPSVPEKPQGDCEKCDYRKFTEQFVDDSVDTLNKYGIKSIEQLSEILK